MTKQVQVHIQTKADARFDGVAAQWDELPLIRGMTKLVKNWIVSKPWWQPPVKGPTLDFGCGTGCLTMALLDGLGEKVTGVDLSQGMLEKFDQKAEGNGVTTLAVKLTGPGQLGKDAGGPFALLYTLLTLHHIQDCEETVKVLASYLRPGGRMLIFDFEATDNAAKFHSPEFELGNQLEHHGISEADLRSWCEKTGVLEDVHIERVPFQYEGGVYGAFGTGEHFQLLALSCTKKFDLSCTKILD